MTYTPTVKEAIDTSLKATRQEFDASIAYAQKTSHKRLLICTLLGLAVGGAVAAAVATTAAAVVSALAIGAALGAMGGTVLTALAPLGSMYWSQYHIPVRAARLREIEETKQQSIEKYGITPEEYAALQARLQQSKPSHADRASLSEEQSLTR